MNFSLFFFLVHPIQSGDDKNAIRDAPEMLTKWGGCIVGAAAKKSQVNTRGKEKKNEKWLRGNAQGITLEKKILLIEIKR